MQDTDADSEPFHDRSLLGNTATATLTAPHCSTEKKETKDRGSEERHGGGGIPLMRSSTGPGRSTPRRDINLLPMQTEAGLSHTRGHSSGSAWGYVNHLRGAGSTIPQPPYPRNS